MREIKFRAWDGELMHNWNHVKEWESLGHLIETQSEFQFMQFTGLQDKNGTDIYDGDVCESNRHTFVVRWVGAGWKLVNINSDRPWASASGKHVRVIGNIHQVDGRTV